MISISKAEHLPSFWNRGPGELWNGQLQKYPVLLISWETSPHFATPPLVSRRNEERVQKFHTDVSHYPLARASDCDHATRENCFNLQKIRVVTRHKYGVSSRVTLTSFRGETSGGVAKRLLFSQATSTSCCGNLLGCCKRRQQESITSCNP